MNKKQRNKQFDGISLVIVLIGLLGQAYNIYEKSVIGNEKFFLWIIGGILSVIMLTLIIAIKMSKESKCPDTFDKVRFRKISRNYIIVLFIAQGIVLTLLCVV